MVKMANFMLRTFYNNKIGYSCSEIHLLVEKRNTVVSRQPQNNVLW